MVLKERQKSIWYSLNKKYNGLSIINKLKESISAINRVTQIWIAIGYTSESDERNRWISLNKNIMGYQQHKYNTFLKSLVKIKTWLW